MLRSKLILCLTLASFNIVPSLNPAHAQKAAPAKEKQGRPIRNEPEVTKPVEPVKPPVKTEVPPVKTEVPPVKMETPPKADVKDTPKAEVKPPVTTVPETKPVPKVPANPEKAPPKPAASNTPPAPKTPKRVYSDFKLVDDPNFQYCGEFMGLARVNHQLGKIGIQIAVKKSGEFTATLYQGGLPGDGWDKTPVVRSSARLLDQLLKFEFSGDILEVNTKEAKFNSGQGTGSFVLTKLLRQSPTIGLAAPADAIVLFQNGKAHKLANPQITPDGFLQEGVDTEEAYRDFRVHAEFKVPYMPDDDDQIRGNSGIYLQNRYEIQILDSFGEDTRYNSIASIYRQKQADLNMALPPLTWQTFDIWFQSATFDNEGKKSAKARVTVFHNGIPVHYDREIETKTGAGKSESPDILPTNFQNHKDPVRFRYIWLQPGKQPLPPNENLKPASTKNQECNNSHDEWEPRSTRYPYARPENYTREEDYGYYGKMWPF